MKRNIINCCVLAGALLLPSVTAMVSASAAAASSPGVTRGSITGTITALDGSTFAIQTAGRRTGVVNALTAAATTITAQDYPYVWGGGHAQAGIASVGIKGHGNSGKRAGYDCSGAVAAVLAAGGLWPAGSGVPNDAGIVVQLLRAGLIAPGAGTGPVQVTLYDDPGVHIFMNIDGRFFGTTDGGGGGDLRGGAGWLGDGAPDASVPIYKRYHFLPEVLRGSTNTGHIDGFELGELQNPVLQLGQRVRVSYEQTPAGRMIATAAVYPGAITASGTVLSVAEDGSSFAIQTATAATLTFVTDGAIQLLQSVATGDTVQVTYTENGPTRTAHAVMITAAPPPSSGTGSVGGECGGIPGQACQGGSGGSGVPPVGAEAAKAISHATPSRRALMSW